MGGKRRIKSCGRGRIKFRKGGGLKIGEDGGLKCWDGGGIRLGGWRNKVEEGGGICLEKVED